MAGAIDATLLKFHTSLNVSNIDRSIAFYRALLGVDPAKARSDYAKFDLAEPPLVLSLIPGRPVAGGQLNHVGLRVRSADELVEIQRRLEAAGLPTQREDGVECCYARQTKFWINDPDGTLWEIYLFHDDIDEHGAAAPPRPVEATTPAEMLDVAPPVWEHRLREPIPDQIPYDDNALHEVRLEGSVNVAPSAPNRSQILREALRTLRPGGALHVHGLAGDGVCDGAVSLPGPASAVQHVPSVSEVSAELAGAGFADIRIDTLSATAYFVVGGVALRELRMSARKPGYRPRTAGHLAIYLGPMREVVDDFGTVFRRGVPTAMNIHDWQWLSRGPSSSAFLLLAPGPSTGDAACCDQPAAVSVNLTGRT